jgi:hypothetical protein
MDLDLMKYCAPLGGSSMRSIAAAYLLAASLLACSGSKNAGSGFNSDGGYTGGMLGGGGDGGPVGMLGEDGGGSTSASCSQAAELVYVIDEQGGLHSFDPTTLTFTTIGTLDCPGAGSSYNSMAVDRDATAWVNDIDGNIFKVSTADASCTATSFVAPPGFMQMGMGFATDMAGGTSETLYVDGIGGAGLAKINLATMALTPIAQFSGALTGLDCELTGTGNAELYGFFTTMPASVAEINKATAGILSNAPQQGVNTGTDWAFSAWGGDFYLYTADTTTNPSDTTNVTRYRPSNNSTTVVKQQIGFRIVGAGVSTCAPTKPPM